MNEFWEARFPIVTQKSCSMHLSYNTRKEHKAVDASTFPAWFALVYVLTASSKEKRIFSADQKGVGAGERGTGKVTYLNFVSWLSTWDARDLGGDSLSLPLRSLIVHFGLFAPCGARPVVWMFLFLAPSIAPSVLNLPFLIPTRFCFTSFLFPYW